jgi:cell division protein FtsZ
MAQTPDVQNYANIKVVGVGGGGSNAVNRMIEAGVPGVEFICMNTDMQVLELSSTRQRLQIGDALTKGLGAGGNPEVGRNAAEESRQDIRKLVEGSDMIFITAGMGGGTGTGAAPVIAEIAKEAGSLTVGVVTKPFGFEGPRRLRIAEEGIANLRGKVDTIITIPNDRLLSVVEKRATLVDAFKMADDILRQAVQGVSDIITQPGMINVDFADVKAVLTESGAAIMGIGVARGDSRAAEAAQIAISSPLLETSMEGARSVLVNITAGPDLTLEEYNEVATVITKATDAEDAFVIIGMALDEKIGQDVRVTVLATGFGPSVPAPIRAISQASARETARPAARAGILSTPPASNSSNDLDAPAFLRNALR